MLRQLSHAPQNLYREREIERAFPTFLYHLVKKDFNLRPETPKTHLVWYQESPSNEIFKVTSKLHEVAF